MTIKTLQSAVALSVLILVARTLAAAPAATDYAISEKGPHHRVWSRTVKETLGGRRTIDRVQSYTEWATGLHYWSEEQKSWVESSDNIEIINGFAVARQGQMQVIWAPNCNSAGAVDMQSTLDGKRFRSHVLGLAFTSAETGASVFFANLKDSIGEVVGNQVMYRDAFDSIAADILYTYNRGRFEQNIVLRQDLPDPSQAPWNMNPATVRVEVYTEFLDAPEAIIKEVSLKRESDIVKRAGMVEPDFADQQLHFGTTLIGSGSAFLIGAGNNSDRVPVAKAFELREGRRVLVERVEYPAIKDEVALLQRAALVPKERVAKIASDVVRGPDGIRRSRLPAVSVKAARLKGDAMRMAQAVSQEKGFVIDYSQLSTMTNAVLASDQTIYISGTVTLSGTTTIEGGVVVKFAPTNNASIQLNGPVACVTAPYRVATFTARDDATIGATIGTNSLSGFYATTALDLRTQNARNLKYIRIAYANTALAVQSDAGPGQSFSHIQILHCRNGLNPINTTYSLRNALMYDVLTNFVTSTYNTTGVLEHVTIDLANYLNTSGGSQLEWLYATNCLFVGITNQGFGYLTNSSAVISNLAAGSSVFQTVGAGAHYLINGSPHRNAGTTNINLTLAAELKGKTTSPPIVLTNDITTNTTLSVIVQRDTDVPDIGYHYDPIDYALHVITLKGGLTLQPAVALAHYGDNNAIILDDAANVVGAGSPTKLARILRYNMVQEQASTNWSSPYPGTFFVDSDNGATTPQACNFRFVDFSFPGGEPYAFSTTGGQRFTVKFQDCQIRGNIINYITDVYMTNCVLERAAMTFYDDLDRPLPLTFCNNTIFGGTLELQHVSTNVFLFRNNLFDNTFINTNYTVDGDYNGYAPGSSNLLPEGQWDRWAAQPVGYQTSWLGRFYIPPTSIFTNHGSTTANLLGLYHYTTQTNQVKETNSIVDIGFHYVAVNASGQPIDTDSDGLPDYIEDSNGNGTVDTGETSYLAGGGDSDGDGVSDYIEFLVGRNRFAGGSTNDFNGSLNLRTYTLLR